jgi:putative sterol carrier protein
MDYQEILEGVKNQAAKTSPLGGTVKFVMGEQVIFIDGSTAENLVSVEDKEANCTLTVSLEEMGKMMAGELNPMMATMMGKMQIKGDMGLAMKLQSLI